MKLCKKCLQNKPLSSYSEGKRYADGKHPWCKDCMRGYRRAWYMANKESVNAKSVAWRKANPQRAREIDRKWKSGNKEKLGERYKKWRTANLSYDTHRVSLRRSAKARAIPAWANIKEIERLYKIAREKTEKTGEDYHVDHIVPLKSPWVCGLHCEANLQVIPAWINLKMGNAIWPDMWVKTDIPCERIENAQRQQRLFA